MCGRFVASSPLAVIAGEFGVTQMSVLEERPSWNVAPTDEVRVVLDRDAERWLVEHRWGLVPHWATSAEHAAAHINARAETVHEKPAFRDAFARSRCLIPVDGFYEWKRGSGQPYFMRPVSGRPIALAGLRSTWQGRLHTCAIVTTEANDRLSAVHHRMPVVLPKAAWNVWLDTAEADLRELLVPAPDELLEPIPVGREVNNVRRDGPHLTDRVPEPVQDALPF